WPGSLTSNLSRNQHANSRVCRRSVGLSGGFETLASQFAVSPGPGIQFAARVRTSAIQSSCAPGQPAEAFPNRADTGRPVERQALGPDPMDRTCPCAYDVRLGTSRHLWTETDRGGSARAGG